MADNAASSENQPAKVVTAGAPVAGKPVFAQQGLENSSNDNNDGGAGGVNNGAAPTNTANTGNDAGDDKSKSTDKNTSTDTKSTIADPTDDQLKAWFHKQGIEFKDAEDLKTKLTPPVQKTEPTPEEKAKIEKDKEHRVLSKFLTEKDATVEKFAALKQVIAADKKILGLEKEITSLVSDGFTPEEARDLAKERYFQYTDDEINAIEDETDKARHIKLRTAGDKKLERKGEYLQKGSKEYLNILEQKLADEDADASLVEQHASNVEAAIKKYERKQTIEMGQVEDQKIDPIGFEVPESAITSAKEIIGDLPTLKKNLLTETGHVNLDFILPHIVKSLAFDAVAKTGYLEGQDRSVKQFKAKFGTNIPILGGNQNGNNGAKGKVVTAGKPVVGRPEFQKNN